MNSSFNLNSVQKDQHCLIESNQGLYRATVICQISVSQMPVEAYKQRRIGTAFSFYATVSGISCDISPVQRQPVKDLSSLTLSNPLLFCWSNLQKTLSCSSINQYLSHCILSQLIGLSSVQTQINKAELPVYQIKDLDLLLQLHFNEYIVA